MIKRIFTSLLTGAMALTPLFAASLPAPKLTVNGTELHYEGKKIFFSGMNLAWMDYNSDVGDALLDENAWRKAVQDIRSAGGNAIRWWLFNNMSQSPEINANTNLVSGLKDNTIANMKKALDIAEEYGVMVSMCLFSHNLMAKDQWGIYAGDKINITANHKLFDDDGTQAFITNVLEPVVESIGLHPALMTWELFNEPEGMSDGWFAETETLLRIQKFSNKVAAAIKAKVPGVLVSTGAHTFTKITNWSDEALINAGGEATGTLDFIQAHFYPEHQTSSDNPFEHPASYWNAGKPIMIGEFWADGWDKETYPAFKVASMTPSEIYRHAIDNGYVGALAWQYIGDQDAVTKEPGKHDFDAAKPGIEAIWKTDSASIKIKDYSPTTTEGDGVMQLDIENLVDEITIERVRNMDWSSATTLEVDVRLVAGSSFSFRPVVKTTDAWTWNDSDEFCEVTDEWTTCSFTLADFVTGQSQIKSVLFQSFSEGFTGSVQFNNVRAGDLVIDNFDENLDLWSRAASMPGGELIKDITTVYIDEVTPIQQELMRGTLLNNQTKGYDGMGRKSSFCRSVNIVTTSGVVNQQGVCY